MATCVIDGCAKLATRRGWCQMHYRRWQRHGDPEAVAPRVRWLGIGERFGRLVIQEYAGLKGGARMYVCLCDCGNRTVVLAKSLKSGHTQSCGCLVDEHIGNLRRTHGMTRHPLYVTWCSMRRRCLTSTSKDYPDYGGRGITVDPRWLDFPQFVADMAPKPGAEYLLDRIDNDGPYSPENCRWATPKESSANKRWHGEGKRAQWRVRAIPAAVEALLSYADENEEFIGFDADELAEVVVDAIAAATRYSHRYDVRRAAGYSLTTT